MQSIFRELYYGNIGFDSQRFGPDSEFVKAARIKRDSMKKLMALLDDSGKELFEAYCSAANDIEDIVKFDTFSSALRFAALFMVEVFTIGDEPPEERYDTTE